MSTDTVLKEDAACRAARLDLATALASWLKGSDLQPDWLQIRETPAAKEEPRDEH